MANDVHVSEQEAMKVAEASRQTEWKQPSFMRELFLGNFRLDLVHPYPLEGEDRPEFAAFYNALKEFMRDHVDSEGIDATGEYPPAVIDGLRKLGAFGMKIPKEYGGLGFDQVEYAKVMEMLGAIDGNVTALLSAHQSIGVPQPLKLFGTPEQKKKYLPRCAKGEISAFALTENGVGSDPARLATTYELTEDGKHYTLNGDQAVVHQRHPGQAAGGDGGRQDRPQDQRLRGRSRLGRGQDRAPLPLHGPARPGQRGDQLHQRQGAGREPDRRRRPRPQDRAHHPERRPPLDPGQLGGRRQTRAQDLPRVGPRAGAVGQADRPPRGDRPQDRRHGGHHLRHGSGRQAGHPDGRTAATSTSASRRRRPRNGTPAAPGRSSTTPCRSAAAAATRPTTRCRPAARSRPRSSG